MSDNTNVERKLGRIEVLALRDATGIVGDKIVGLFQDNIDLKYVYCHFPILENGSKMFWGCENLETFFTNSPDYVGLLPNLENGSGMFYYTKLSEFATELPKMTNGSQMFLNCSKLKTFKSDLKALKNYYEMFKDDKLNLFEANEINVTDTGEHFMSTSGLSNSYNSLANVNCNFPQMTDTNSMFKNFSALKTFKGDFNTTTNCNYMFAHCYSYDDATGITTGLESVQGNFNRAEYCESMFGGCGKLISVQGNFNSAKYCNSMFRGCGKLNSVNCPMNVLQDGKHMFRGCKSLNETNVNLGYFYNSLTNALCMFEDTGFTQIPWNFPNVTRTQQMFKNSNIQGHLKLDMSVQFPSVNDAHGSNTTPYMFDNCKITSLDFNVETVGNGVCMFQGCYDLTDCTSAKFKQNGDYQNMFTYTKFDEASVIRIFDAGIEANVTKLHIGMNGLPSENLKNKYGLIQFDQGYNEQWCRGTLPYCKCHANTTGWVCETVQEEVKQGNMENLVPGSKDDSIVIVCNNI